MENVTCPRCGKEKAIISRRYGILPGKNCQADDKEHNLADKPEFYTISKSNRVQEQRDHFAKDMLQPYTDGKGTPSEDFAKAYPDKIDDYYEKGALDKI